MLIARQPGPVYGCRLASWRAVKSRRFVPSFEATFGRSDKAAKGGRASRALRPFNRAMVSRSLARAKDFSSKEMNWAVRSSAWDSAAGSLTAAFTANSVYSLGRCYKVF